MSKGGWIGVDFDGTLAHYERWEGPAALGEPIKPMVERVKRWLSEGRDVRIFTARVDSHSLKDAVLAHRAIEEWCLRHIGKVLRVTNMKDMHLVEFYDDRCVTVEQNTGRLLTPSTRGLGD